MSLASKSRASLSFLCLGCTVDTVARQIVRACVMVTVGKNCRSNALSIQSSAAPYFSTRRLGHTTEAFSVYKVACLPQLQLDRLGATG